MAKPKSNQQLLPLLKKAAELHESGNLAGAQASYVKYLKHRPDDGYATGLLAVVKFQQGFSAAALDLMTRAAKLAPDEIGVRLNHARMLTELKRYDDAEAVLRHCLAANPQMDGALNNLGLVLLETGRPAEASEAFLNAIRVSPNQADYHFNLASSFSRSHKNSAAEVALRKACELAPDDVEFRLALAKLLYHNNKHSEAVAHFSTVLDREPNQFDARTGLMYAKLRLCDWDGFDEQRTIILSNLDATIRKEGTDSSSPFVVTLISGDPEACYKAACARSPRSEKRTTHTHRALPSQTDCKIKVAYVSADYHEHPTSRLLRNLIELHDRSRFEIIGVSLGPDDESPMRARMVAAFDQFIDVANLTSVQIADVLRDMKIDIAVDLLGFTANNRIELFSKRAAPIQVNYLGWPGTSGSDCYDYILADPIVIPPENVRYFAERVVWLPGPYQPNDRYRIVAETVPTRAECGLPSNSFVFACFNNPNKIMPEVFSAWMRILKAVSGSIMWLLDGGAEQRSNLEREATVRGVSPERLVFAPFVSNEAHLARHRQMDLVLDTMPYNAHTTASDALWMGVPVVSCTGKSFAGRVATSLLAGCGLEELATSNLEAYEELAVTIATSPTYLNELKGRLTRDRDRLPLFDTPRLARDIERAYAEMIARHRRGQPISPLDVRALAGDGP